MTFPQFTVRGPITQLEVEALRSLYTASLHLRQEYDAAVNRTLTHNRLGDIAEDNARGKAFTHHHDVLRQMASAADRYERDVGMLAWRHASAAVRLGTRVLERLVHGQAPLGVDEVAALCDEPTLGELRTTLSTPADTLVPHRDQLIKEHQEKSRRQLLQAVEGVFSDAAHLDDRHKPLPDDVVAGFRLTQVSPPDMDPLYEGRLEQLLIYAEGLPHEISVHLEHTTGR
ncbi:hypothetical protein ACIRP5_31685 [Streptomyces sp. NPDC101221]|uniref:hypothetical protein n=1 Tax=Streptomyces sp. NPDC101221 TaxID=3366132 RepID=UPI0038057E6D